MKRMLSIVLALMLLVIGSTACSKAESPEETNAKSILQSTQAHIGTADETVDVSIEEIELIKTQKAYNHEYSYFVVKTDEYDWGYAELRDGMVKTFKVGYSESEAKTRCKDAAAYRLTEMGGLYEMKN